MEDKYLIVRQAVKHVLVGGVATLADLACYIFFSEIFLWIYRLSPATIKAGSFTVAAVIKYIGNKFWTFRKTEQGMSRQEFGKFFSVNLLGLGIDVFVFQLAFSLGVWEKLAVLLAAVFAGIWNFLGDKFLVFKK